MTKPAAIQGTFADLKIIKTRSAVQIIVEIAIEQADQALAALGGVPQPGEERPVAVARLKVQSGEANCNSEPESTISEPSETSRPDPHRLSRQAAMLCGDEQFNIFLAKEHGLAWRRAATRAAHGSDTPKFAVHDLCQVQSRAEFDKDEQAAARWNALYAEWELWRGGDR